MVTSSDPKDKKIFGIGMIMSYSGKLIKHINNNDCERLKDYFCNVVMEYGFEELQLLPPYEKALSVLKENGWVIKVRKWYGKDQIGLWSPDGRYFHS